MDALSDVGRDQLIWTLAGALLAVVVGFVLVSFVGAIVFGIFLYYALRPVYERLDARLAHPDVSVTITLLVVGLPAILVLGYAALVGFQELNQLLGQQPFGEALTLLDRFVDVGALTRPSRLVEVAQNNFGQVLGVAGTALRWAIRLFVILTVAFYLLRDDHRLGGWYRESFDDVTGAVAFMDGVDDDLDTIYTGNLITIGITGLIAAVVYYAFEWVTPETAIAYPILLGFLVGLFTIVPAVGMKAIYLPFAGYLLVRALLWNQLPLWVPIVFLVVTLVIVDTLPDIVIRSYVSSGDINMGLMMLSYVLGSVAFGWYGVFLGPIVLVLAIHFAREVLPRLVAGRTPRVSTD